MSPTTFEVLLSVIGRLYENKLSRGDNPVITPRKGLLLTIFYLAHQDTLNEISDRFNVAESTVLYEVEYVINILVNLRSRYIIWPRENDCEVIATEFEARAGFPGVVGSIDGTHISIVPPAAQQMSYANRKMFHSIVLQAICTSSKLFTDVCVGVPGRRADAAVLKFSHLYQACKENGTLSKFYNPNYHLIGDSAYPSFTWLLPPIKQPLGRNLTAAEKRYNHKHSATRVVIENAFALLKGRWGRLRYIYVKDVSKVSDITVAACVLHNFCIINHDDNWDQLYQENEQRQRPLNFNNENGNYDNQELMLGQEKIHFIQDIL